MLTSIVLSFAMVVSGPTTTCGAISATELSLANGDDIVVAAIQNVTPAKSSQQTERGTLSLKIIDILTGPPRSSETSVEYERSAPEARRYHGRPPFLPWNAVAPSAGKIVLLGFYPNSNRVASVQSLESADDPLIALIRTAVGIRGLPEEELTGYLDDACDIIRDQAIRSLLRDTKRCLPGSPCRDKLLSREISRVDDMGVIDGYPSGRNRRADALRLLTENMYFGWQHSGDNLRIIAVAVRHLDDEDVAVRKLATRFVASLVSDTGPDPDLLKVLASQGRPSCDKLNADVLSGADFSNSARVVLKALGSSSLSTK